MTSDDGPNECLLMLTFRARTVRAAFFSQMKLKASRFSAERVLTQQVLYVRGYCTDSAIVCGLFHQMCGLNQPAKVDFGFGGH